MLFWSGLAVGIAAFVLLIAYMEPDQIDHSRYKEGQIDAMTGKIHYHLVVNDDSTRTWEKINKEN